jgi:hypothetical protein
VTLTLWLLLPLWIIGLAVLLTALGQMLFGWPPTYEQRKAKKRRDAAP